MISYGPFTITLGQTTQESLPGSSAAAAAVRFYNLSPYTLLVTVAGQTMPIAAESRDIVIIDPGWQWDGSFTAVPQDDLNLMSPVSFVLRLVVFGAGETIPGTDPATFTHTIGGGVTGVAATEVVNTGNSPGTIMVQGSSNGSAGSLTEYNDGSGSRQLYDAGNFVTVESYTNGTGLAEAAAQYGVPSDLAVAKYYGDATVRNLSFQDITSVNGTTTAGPLSVPVGTPTIRQHITTTGLQVVYTESAPITGLYRIFASFKKKNATSSAVTFEFTYTDPDDASVNTIHFSADIAGTYTNFAGSTTVGAAVAHCFACQFPATVGTTISASFNDPTGTPNDFISVTVEALL